MRIAASNIAWAPDEDELAARLLCETGVEGVEIAPTRVWPDPLGASPSELLAHRRFWESRGLEIVALQALLFGRPDLVLFGEEAAREALLVHLDGMFRIAAALGARKAVFGAPGSRRLLRRSRAQAFEIAVAFFREAGALAAARDVVLCIEPSPAAAGCDFVQTAAEGLELVRAAGGAGFGLHLDAAALTLGEASPPAAVLACAGAIQHVHASEPELAPVGAGTVAHRPIATALRQTGYAGWVSLEMRREPVPHREEALRRAFTFVRETYGD